MQLSLQLNDATASLILTSASFSDKSINSNYSITSDTASSINFVPLNAISASWAPSIPNNTSISSSWASQSLSSSYSLSSNVTWYTASVSGIPLWYTQSFSQNIGNAEVYIMCTSTNGGYLPGDMLKLEQVMNANIQQGLESVSGGGNIGGIYFQYWGFNSSSIWTINGGYGTLSIPSKAQPSNNSWPGLSSFNGSDWVMVFRVTNI